MIGAEEVPTGGVVAEDSTKAAVAGITEILTEGHGKCIKQHVLNAKMNARFHLNQEETNLYTAEIAIRPVGKGAL